MGWADGTEPITNDAEVIDSREVIARIEYLESIHLEAIESGYLPPEVTLGADDSAELAALVSLAAEASDYAADWIHGETLIRDDHFTDYVEQLVDDCYEKPTGFDSSEWPWRHMEMDWEAAADEAKQDYTSVDFGGVTYWIR